MRSKKQDDAPAEDAPVRVNFEEVERLLEFMAQHGLEEFEYKSGGLRIRMRKPAAGGRPAPRGATAPDILAPRPEFSESTDAQDLAGVKSGEGSTGAAGAPGHGEDAHLVKSPIVGTFYGSPSPGAQAFVRQGDRVESGQVLCIIEAMKLMNEIEADMAGEVLRIFCENGQPVEYGEPLFAIHPLRKK
jgi:acetyl-CoA carboxylase biotin carboxyl carrier protein